MRWATTCVSRVTDEEEIELEVTNQALVEIERELQTATAKHNAFLKELGLPLLPDGK